MAILIVDDETKARETLRHLLHHLGYKTILEAKNGEEAHKILELSKTRVKMILSDLDMPYCNGLLLSEKVQTLSSSDLTPFVLISSDSLASGYYRQRGHIKPSTSRIDSYLSKPFRSERLLTAMRQAFEKRSRVRNKLIFIGDRIPPYCRLALNTMRNPLWTDVQLIPPTNFDEISKAICEDKLSAIIIDTACLAQSQASELNALFFKFKKSPQGIITPIACLGLKPRQVYPFRTFAQFFIEAPDSLKDWTAFLSQIQTRVISAWDLGILFQNTKISLQNRNPKQAFNLIKKILKIDKNHSEALAISGSLHEELGEPKKASYFYTASIASNPCLPTPYIKLLNLRSVMKPITLIQVAELGAQYCPGNLELKNLASQIFCEFQDIQKSRETVQDLLSNHSETNKIRTLIQSLT